MRSACNHRASASAKTQELHVRWELGGLMTVAACLLSDITKCVASCAVFVPFVLPHTIRACVLRAEGLWCCYGAVLYSHLCASVALRSRWRCW